MQPRLAEVMSFVEQKRREFLTSFEGVDGELLSRRDGQQGWSVAEILEHLRMVESGVARLIAKRVSQARAGGLRDEKATSSVMPSFDRHAAYLEGAVLKSPAIVQPRADVDISQALDGLAESRQALHAAVLTAGDLALGEIKHDHVVLGELDLYQWLIFLGQHEARHTRQIERTLKSIPA